MGMSEFWLAPAAVVPQESGADWLDEVDGQAHSLGRGFHRGFSSSFALSSGKDVWFHWPFQTEAGARIDGFKLLWETQGDARIGWIVCHHGGAERIQLTDRLATVSGISIPFEPPQLWREYYPAMDRKLSEFQLASPFVARFGVQLCVMVAGGTGGVVRFYGAAVMASRAD